MHLVRDARETLRFREALDAESDRVRHGWGNIWHYTRGSFYSDRTQKYLDKFGSARMKVVLFEDWSGIRRGFSRSSARSWAWILRGDSSRGRSTTGRGAPISVSLAAFVNRPGPIVKRVVRSLPEPLVRGAKQAIARLNVGEKGRSTRTLALAFGICSRKMSPAWKASSGGTSRSGTSKPPPARFRVVSRFHRDMPPLTQEYRNGSLAEFLHRRSAQAGTSSFYAYLRDIPGIYMSSIKEPNYFSRVLVPDDHPVGAQSRRRGTFSSLPM